MLVIMLTQMMATPIAMLEDTRPLGSKIKGRVEPTNDVGPMKLIEIEHRQCRSIGLKVGSMHIQ